MTRLIRPEGAEPGDLNVSRRMALGAGALGGLLFSGYAPAALAAQAKPITTDDDGLTIETATSRAFDEFELPFYSARPTGRGPYPVVVVVSEIFGLHEYIRDVCRRLAKAGYAAIAPAFFVRVEDPAPLTDMARIQQIVAAAKPDQVLGDIATVLNWAYAQPWAAQGKAGITGFCWGGKVVWQACARYDILKAGVAWYGRLSPTESSTQAEIQAGEPWPIELVEELKCPVLGLYGGADQGIPMSTVDAMTATLDAAGKDDSEIVVYPTAPHGFHADYRDSYREADAKAGWSRLLETFETRLKPPVDDVTALLNSR